MVRDRPLLRLRLRLVRRGVPRARARELGEGRRRVAHDPADRHRRAGRSSGSLAYLALVAVSLALLFRGLRARAESRAWPGIAAVAQAGIAAAYAALLLHTLVYAAYLEDPLTWALLAIAAGLRARAGRPRIRATPRPGRRRRTVALDGAVAEPLVLPEYGPTLPTLARRRFGWRERTTVALLVGGAR